MAMAEPTGPADGKKVVAGMTNAPQPKTQPKENAQIRRIEK